MFKIEIVKGESFDDETQTFITTDSAELLLEHSLVSLSKWESKWEKPFLGNQEKTSEETLDYIRCMVLNEVSEEDFNNLSAANMKEISDYINAKQTATWVNDDTKDKNKRNTEVVTSELIYYWMLAHQIPFECQHWHLNRLMTLIRVCNAKNQPEKKMSKVELQQRNRSLNEQRKAKYKTKG